MYLSGVQLPFILLSVTEGCMLILIAINYLDKNLITSTIYCNIVRSPSMHYNNHSKLPESLSTMQPHIFVIG